MYVDRKGYVTTGLGNLIATTPSTNVAETSQITEEGLSLPWRRGEGGPLASREEIRQAFETVKRSGMENAGGGNQGHLTTLRLNPEDVRALVRRKLEQMEVTLRQFFPGYDSWPADAQLGLLSMSWAMGPAFARKYPKFTAYANNALLPDFVGMAEESIIPELGMKEGGRNKDQIQLFTNAAKVMQQNLDPNVLYWAEGLLNDAAEFVAKGAKPALGGAGILLLLMGGGSAAYYLAKHKGLL